MIDVESMTSIWDKGATVFIEQPGTETMWRPALFVYGDPGGGFTWVEPGYLDPWGAASPATHTAESPATDVSAEENGPAIEASSPAWTARAVGLPAGEMEQMRQPIEWALGELKRRGTTWAAERERVRAILAQGQF